VNGGRNGLNYRSGWRDRNILYILNAERNSGRKSWGKKADREIENIILVQIIEIKLSKAVEY